VSCILYMCTFILPLTRHQKSTSYLHIIHIIIRIIIDLTLLNTIKITNIITIIGKLHKKFTNSLKLRN